MRFYKRRGHRCGSARGYPDGGPLEGRSASRPGGCHASAAEQISEAAWKCGAGRRKPPGTALSNRHPPGLSDEPSY